MHFFVHARLGVVPWAILLPILTAHPMILTIFRPLFYETFSSVWTARISISEHFWRKYLTFGCTFVVHARLGVVLSILLYPTLWFLQHLWTHYFRKLSTVFGKYNFQFEQCWRKFNFRMQFCCPCTAGRGSVHVHPNFMILTIFRLLFYETFSSFGQQKYQFWQCLEKM